VESHPQAEEPVVAAHAPPRPQLLRDWRSILFAPVGDGQRRRRGSDGLRLAGAILALICCLLIIRYDSRIDRAIGQVIHPPPRSITWLVTVVYDVGAFGVTIAVVALALIARRWVVARDIGLSAVVTAVPRQVWGVAKYRATQTADGDGGSPGNPSPSRSTAGTRPTPSC
jgi:hypothetical protein